MCVGGGGGVERVFMCIYVYMAEGKQIIIIIIKSKIYQVP